MTSPMCKTRVISLSELITYWLLSLCNFIYLFKEINTEIATITTVKTEKEKKYIAYGVSRLLIFIVF